MRTILSDENCSGHAEAIFHSLKRLGLLEIISLELKTFEEVGLAEGTSDETVWRFCQERRYLLLIGNRSAKDQADSLEYAVRQYVTSSTLPVLTIGDLKRIMYDRNYCDRCAERLAEIALDVEERHLGVTRLYLS